VLEHSPVDSPRIAVERIQLEISDRDFQKALSKIHATNEAVYEQAFGERGRAMRALDECSCGFFMGDEALIADACGRTLAIIEQSSRGTGRLDDTPQASRHLRARALAYLGGNQEVASELDIISNQTRLAEDAIGSSDRDGERAALHSILGDREPAYKLIEDLLSRPSVLTVGGLRVHPVWDNLRDDSRFQEILEKYDTN
jgi:hypothetical protein